MTDRQFTPAPEAEPSPAFLASLMGQIRHHYSEWVAAADEWRRERDRLKRRYPGDKQDDGINYRTAMRDSIYAKDATDRRNFHAQAHGLAVAQMSMEMAYLEFVRKNLRTYPDRRPASSAETAVIPRIQDAQTTHIPRVRG